MISLGPHLLSGLVDCTSETDFEASVKNLEEIWNAREAEATQTDSPKFYCWFTKYQVSHFKSKMLLPLRQSLG